MPFNGSGTFTIVNTFVPNTTILSAAVNQNFTDIATGLSDCLTRDGQAGMTAVLKAVSGSVSAPGITFNADATAGLYLSSTGIVGLVAKSLGILINSAIYQVSSAAVQAGGSGYAVGDTITLTGGTAINQAVCTVATLSGTAVATVTVTYGGNYTVQPANPAAQGSTDGLGTGCTLNLTFATQFTRSVATDESGNAVWQRLGASSFVSGLMAYANGLDFVNGIGATNIAAGLGLSAPPPGASFKNLVIKVATNTTLTASADFVVTTNGTKYQTTALSSTINMATTGANALDTGSIASATWYAIWAIAKPDGTTAGLASTSFTTPTMPSGYTYKARIGAVRTAAGSAQLMGTWQFARDVQYVVGLAQTTTIPGISNGNAGNITTPTWVALAVGTFVPTTASAIDIVLNLVGGGTAGAIAAPNNSYGGNASTNNAPPLMANGGGTVAQNISLSGRFILESTNIYWANSNGTNGAIYCRGWVDNL
jgi:hypothetical protein